MQTKNPLNELKNVDLSHLSKQEAKEFTLLLEELELREKRETSIGTFYEFVKNIWPEFIAGSHHKKMAEAFDKIANGLKSTCLGAIPLLTKVGQVESDIVG